jgi:general secretion pathway protein D
VEIEISTVRDHVDIGGISQPVIGQRKVIHDIRLQEGEGSIIGGLMQTQTSKQVSGVPVLAQIPVLGRLFSSEHNETSENEILIVLLPHVVRMPDLTDLNLRGISAGTDQTVRVSFTDPDNGLPALPPTPTPAAPGAPGAPGAPVTAPAAPPAVSPPAVPAPSVPAPALAPPTPAGVTPPAPGPPIGVVNQPLVPGAPSGQPATLQFDQPKITAPAGGKITLNLVAQNAADLFSTNLQIDFDASKVRLADAVRGALLSSDGQDLVFSKNIQNDSGRATISIARFPGAGGVSGGGVLLRLELEAASAGTSTLRISSVEAHNAREQVVPMGTAEAEIVIQ